MYIKRKGEWETFTDKDKALVAFRAMVQEIEKDEIEQLKVTKNVDQNVKIIAEKNKTQCEIKVVVSGLTSLLTCNMDLHVAADTIIITLGQINTNRIKIEGKFNPQKDKILAKMSKKTGKLTITCPLKKS